MEKAKTFRKERTYLIYGIILFFILINLFFLPKSTNNVQLVNPSSIHSTTPLIPTQPDNPLNSNNMPEATETKPITTIPEDKKEDKPPVVEKPKEEEKTDSKDNKKEEKQTDSNKDNTEKVENGTQEKPSEKPKEEPKVVLPPTEVKEEPKTENKPTETSNKEEEKVAPVSPKVEESKPEDNNKKDSNGREQMNIQQATSRRFLRGFENFCMFGFIGVIVYLIYNNGENNSEQQNQDNHRDDNKKKDPTNPSGYALLDDDAEYYENI